MHAILAVLFFGAPLVRTPELDREESRMLVRAAVVFSAKRRGSVNVPASRPPSLITTLSAD
jgi:hypothetical protein